MTNNQAFCITYGGSRRDGRTFVPYTAIAHSADEAIAIINTWHGYGAERRGNNRINVNEQTAEKIRSFFAEGINPDKTKDCGYRTVRTTNCGAWSISFYPALADTIEEHTRIYNEQREAAKQERLRKAEEAKQRRLAELNEQKRGWYHAELEVRVLVFNNQGNDYFTDLTFSGNGIAGSGMDAFDKAWKHLQDNPQELTHRGNIATIAEYIDPTSNRYNFTFLGVKTDDGYSVEKWEEWKKNGEI